MTDTVPIFEKYLLIGGNTYKQSNKAMWKGHYTLYYDKTEEDESDRLRELG